MEQGAESRKPLGSKPDLWGVESAPQPERSVLFLGIPSPTPPLHFISAFASSPCPFQERGWAHQCPRAKGVAREGEAETRLGRDLGGKGTPEALGPSRGKTRDLDRAPELRSPRVVRPSASFFSLFSPPLGLLSRPPSRPPPLCPANFTDSFWSLRDSRRPTVFMEVGSTFNDTLRIGFLCREGKSRNEI